ncbi:hypothetical protein B0H14DRAFT_2625407 [Mycena olivaceomarginata]|nr:hypothetical protein B0H14DRAFT_2625407 [Mycena olivaceomarginata]
METSILKKMDGHVPYSTQSVRLTWWYALYCTKQAGLRRPLQGTCWDDSRGDPILRQAKGRKATNQVLEPSRTQDTYARNVIQRGRRELIYGRESDNVRIQESAYTPYREEHRSETKGHWSKDTMSEESSTELWWDERRMHGSAEMTEKQEEPQLRS